VRPTDKIASRWGQPGPSEAAAATRKWSCRRLGQVDAFTVHTEEGGRRSRCGVVVCGGLGSPSRFHEEERQACVICAKVTGEGRD
jgi:hypothetical protein